jgi:hypothetical protein
MVMGKGMLVSARSAIALTRLALLAILALGLLLSADPAMSQARLAPALQSTTDLGAPDEGGVTREDRLAGTGQARAYTFTVGPGSSVIQVYVGDLWYDVDVTLWRLAGRSDDLASRAAAGCDRGDGCLAAGAPIRRRVVQFIEPKTIVEVAEGGSYAVLVRPRDDPSFDASRPFTLRVAVTPPVCAIERGPDDRYSAALAVIPSSPSRSSLITMVAYLMPPYTDLFDFSWSVEGAPVPNADGAIAQVPGFSLPRTPSGTVVASVTIRGARQYTDPTDPTYSHVPLDGGTMTVRCDVRIADR